ncbi:L,D-transpeptidase family protein [Echinicola soli]|uniref:L,D-transpeptidase family protein n=1 Tax=Echinicola soli TaxID=2591634 RepID=A0A514CHU2_9BACT|nr:L,D-transpeptidase family protein [Echinicola soli]QDH79382.1 L,D-transpeptidase family protein [Echinicola soli]
MDRCQKWIVLGFLFFTACSPELDEDTLEKFKERLKGEALEEVYGVFDYQPIWINAEGLSESGEWFFELLDEEIAADGLDRNDYQYESIKQRIDSINQGGEIDALVSLELEISEAFIHLGNDLHYGRVDPDKRSSKWKMEPKAMDLDVKDILIEIGKGNESSFSEVLDQLRPGNRLYEGLREEMKGVLEAGGSLDKPHIEHKEALEVGDRHQVVVQVRKALEAMGEEGISKSKEPEVYDQELEGAVKRFQKKHGLKEDGVLGEDFWRAINYSTEDLMVKLKVNLERLRWLPDFLSTDGPKVLVNIPNYFMDYIVDQDTVFSTRAVVGKEYYQTPVFTAKMSYVVFSPYWNLPEGILWAETIPAILKDKNYLSEHNMEIVDRQGELVKPNKVPWKKLTKEEGFPYLIRQKPGDDNALGRVKFMFPNSYNIYIHDSPAKALFDRDERAFSHGCIRIANPDDFAAVLLQDKKEWDKEAIAGAMQLEKEKQVNLEHKPSVWILYLTAWRSAGGLQLREDVYGSDKKLAQKMGGEVSNAFF